MLQKINKIKNKEIKMKKFIVNEKEFRKKCGDMIFSKNTLGVLFYKNGELKKSNGEFVYTLYGYDDVRETPFYKKFDSIVTSIDKIFVKLFKSLFYAFIGVAGLFIGFYFAIPMIVKLFL